MRSEGGRVLQGWVCGEQRTIVSVVRLSKWYIQQRYVLGCKSKNNIFVRNVADKKSLLRR